MEKVSVATRFPFMKTPKDPESTICPVGSLPALTAAPAIKSRQNVPGLNIALNVTSLLLQFLCLPQFSAGAPLRLRPRRRSCRQFQPALCQSCNGGGAPHTTGETVPNPAAVGAPLFPARSAETTPPRERPGRLMALASEPAVQHFQSAQKLRPITLLPEDGIPAL